MKVNYVLMYGTPYLHFKAFETFDDISNFLVHKGIVNYRIFKLMEDNEEVELIYLHNDIHVLEQRINKAIEYIEEHKTKGYRVPLSDDYELWNEIKELLEILDKGEDKQ